MNIKDCCSSFYVYKAAASCTQPLFSSVPSASGVESVVGTEQNVKLASIRQCSAGVLVRRHHNNQVQYEGSTLCHPPRAAAAKLQ